ncbi:hypothetical protein P280DRAFT_519998 [Massarina eburnea CBS 473.64]|uniref:WSC domain-containing protein n=1 Tax=Massarina eburnea CBS 473.64 TaxID=1395130 RepID=A0A6A6RT45_9PLEO|nr:hypothetical protein P280DRAFT_519998 [Massarina eburnea CBS 473.64]
MARNVSAALLALLALLLLATPVRADGFVEAYCSSHNTASGSASPWTYQSNGWCTDHCKGSAFAVILENNCWCSDYAPGDGTTDTGSCDDDCPGFPSEHCGNKQKNLYIYIKNTGTEPSGTQGASVPTSSSKVSSSSSAPASSSSTPSTPPPAPPSSTSAVRTSQAPETVVQTVTGVPEEVTRTYSPPASSAASSTPETSAAPITPQTSTRIVTQSGMVMTQTVITTPTAQPLQENRKSSSNTGAIVGGAVGGVVGLAAVAGMIVFLLFRRRRQRDEYEDESGVHRNVSTLSRSGLIRSEKLPAYPSPIATNIRQSRTLDQESISPISSSRGRMSRHMTDQRLNPSTVMYFDNPSSGSVGTIDDSRDYNRTLNVRNPDP